MPDILTGPEEQEIMESVYALKSAKDRLDPTDAGDASIIAQLQLRIDLLTQTIAEEVPSPKPCTCNPPEVLKCEYGHVLGPDGYSTKMEYIPMELSV